MNPNIQHAVRLSSGGGLRSLGVAAAGFVLTACTSLHVGSDYNRAASFTNYQTYAWLAREHQPASHPLAVQNAHAAINSELSRPVEVGWLVLRQPARCASVPRGHAGNRRV
jgi:hypothetical protein